MKKISFFAVVLLLTVSCTKTIEDVQNVNLSVSFKSAPVTFKSGQKSGHIFTRSGTSPTASAADLGIVDADVNVSGEGVPLYSASIPAASLSSFTFPVDLGIGLRIFNVAAVNSGVAGVYGFEGESSIGNIIDGRLFMRFNSGDVEEDVQSATTNLSIIANLKNPAIVIDFESPIQGDYSSPMTFKYTVICNGVTYTMDVPTVGGSYEGVLNMDVEEMSITEIKRDLYIGDLLSSTDEIKWDGNDISALYPLTFESGVLGRLSVSNTLSFQPITGSIIFEDWQEHNIELGE
jgi:hypothetical protein